MAVLVGLRWVRVAAWLLAGCTVLVLVAALVLLGLDARVMGAGWIAWYGASAVAVGVYAWVGWLIAARVPGNVIGWLLCLVGLALAAAMFCEQYALRGLATAPGSLSAVRMVGWLSEAAFTLAVVLLFFIVLLFPDGAGCRHAAGGRCYGRCSRW